MLLCWSHKPFVELVYIERTAMDRVTTTKFTTYHGYQTATVNTPRHVWDNYRTWHELRLAKYMDVKTFIRNIFKSI